MKHERLTTSHAVNSLNHFVFKICMYACSSVNASFLSKDYVHQTVMAKLVTPDQRHRNDWLSLDAIGKTPVTSNPGCYYFTHSVSCK